jgi:hypothetical protein
MATSQADEGDGRRASIAELLRSLLADIALLAHREGELALIEVKEKASEVGIAVGFAAAGALAAVFAAATVIAAAVLALAIALPAWAAALIVAAVLLVVATTLALIARTRLRAASLAPTRTLQTLREDIGWIRLQTEHLKTSE